MDFKDFWDKLVNSKGAKELKDLAEMTEDQIESIGKKILEKSKSAGDKTMDFIDTEGSKLFEKAKKRIKDITERGTEEINEFFRDKDSEEVDLDEIFGKEDIDINPGEGEAKAKSSDKRSSDKKGDFIDKILAKVEKSIDSAERIIDDRTNLEAIKDINLIPDDFIEKARRFADTTLTRGKSKKRDSGDQDIAGFTDNDGDGDPLIDDAIVDEDV